MLGLLDSYPFPRENGRDGDREAEVLFAGVTDKPLQEMLDTLRREGYMLSDLEEHAQEAIRDAYKNNTRIMRKFLPRLFHGDILLFVATQREAKPPIESWRLYADGQIMVHEIDCTHETMMSPLPIAKIGSVLAIEIDKQRKPLEPLRQRRST